MTALQVYAILNKRVRGLISGVKSAVVNGTTITFEMNDGTKVPMTFPTPKDGKDGISVVDIEIKKVIIGGETKKHLIFTMSDGSTIDSGELESSSGGVVSKDTEMQFPSVGNEDILYLAKNDKKLFYWDGAKYQPITSDDTSSVSAEIKTATINFDGVSDTFDLPVDDISYNVYVNGIYYTESVDYTIDNTVSPNRIIFNEIYDDYESCTLTYLKKSSSISGDGGNCSCEFEYATKSDIDNMFSGENMGVDISSLQYATKNDIDVMFPEGGSDGN